MAGFENPSELALFPVQAVLFPGGLLSLKVFESRYVDLITSCLRESRPFGVVALRGSATSTAQTDDASPDLESTGVVAELISADSAPPGVLQVRCRGLQRFVMAGSRRQADGLWLTDASLLPGDPAVAPGADMHNTVRGLANAIAALRSQGVAAFSATVSVRPGGLGGQPLVRDLADLGDSQATPDGTG